MNASAPPSKIKFKGSTAPVIVVTVNTLDADVLRLSADEHFGGKGFFDNDAGILNLAEIPPEASLLSPDWSAIAAAFSRHGLKLIGIRGGNPDLVASAHAKGLAYFPEETPRHAAAPIAAAATETQQPAPVATNPATEIPAACPAQSEGAPELPPAPASALIVQQPVRGGQTLYARGGDLVALAGVNAGAGVMADGNVHVYGPLRGEVMAGASGDTQACIFTTCFAAKLVSIAGLYRNFAEGIPAEFAGKPVVIRLAGEKITLERLRLD